MAKYCSECGASLPDNAKFCSECGFGITNQLQNVNTGTKGTYIPQEPHSKIRVKSIERRKKPECNYHNDYWLVPLACALVWNFLFIPLASGEHGDSLARFCVIFGDICYIGYFIYYLVMLRYHRVMSEYEVLKKYCDIVLLELQEADSIKMFMDECDELKHKIEELKSLHGRSKKADSSIDFVDVANSYRIKKDDFQWWLRNSIERQKKHTIHLCTNDFANSTERRRSAYESFDREVSTYRDLFSEETIQFTENCRREISFVV